MISCGHCDYANDELEDRLEEVDDQVAWVCPACAYLNTTYYTDDGYTTVAGYHVSMSMSF